MKWPRTRNMAPAAEPTKVSVAEVRAWIGFGVVMFVHTIGIVWWAATLSAEVRQLQTLLVDQKGQFSSLEQRVRTLEIKAANPPNVVVAPNMR